MNNKKVQANMQINVSFLGDTAKLVKQLESDVQKLNLNSTLETKIGTNLDKNFKNVYTNLDKMIKGLSEKGLSSKQYTEFFNTMQDKLKSSIQFTKNLKSDLQDMFNSSENQQALKDLEQFRKKLEEINKLASKQKSANTRQQTAVNKLKDETGLNYEVSKQMLSSIEKRKANKLAPTKAQQDWATANGLDEAKLKRALELLKQIEAQAKKVTEINKQAKDISGLASATVESAQKSLTNKIDSIEGFSISPDFLRGNEQALGQLSAGGELLDRYVDELLPKFNNNLSISQQEAEKLTRAGMTLNEIFAQFGIAFTAANVVRGLQDLVRNAFDFYKSLDSALNEIYVVSNLTSNQVDNLKTSFIDMAKDTGMALDDVTRSAVLFYQQGLNTDEVMVMTEVTSQFAKVAGIDATDAADKLTAAVNGYCLAAEDAASVADKFNQVAAVSAADINELSTAFSKAAAQANQAGVSMDNYLAYIATMEEATREAPENIGTSLKTIFSRMQQVKDSGTTEDGDTDVNQVETALKSVGVQLRDVNGELRDLQDVFDELGPKWNTLDRNTQAYLGTIIAGTRQQSRFITLMQNWDRVLDLATESENSAGKQALMHAKAMESIESKVQQANVAWQEFISNLTNSSIIKGVITLFTKFINTINSGSKPLTLLSLGFTLLAKKAKDLQLPITQKFKDLFKTLKDGRKNIVSTVDNLKELNNVRKQINSSESIVSQKQKDYDELLIQRDTLAVLQNKSQEEQEQLTKIEGKLTQIRLEKEQEQETLTILKEKQALLKNQNTGLKQLGGVMSGIGVAFQTVSLFVSDSDANMSSLMSTVGSGMETIGNFATGNWIGGIISLTKTVFQGINMLDNWEKNIEAKVTGAVNAINDAMVDLSNTSTSARSIESMIKKYNELNNKLYRTTAEQEELNNVIQEMGDTLDIDTITDSYGNLSISIATVTQRYEELIIKQNEALEKMKEVEAEQLKEAQSGLGNNTTEQEVLDKIYSKNASEYRSLLTGLQDNLTSETRNISNSLYQSINAAFKESLANNLGDNMGAYVTEGFAEGLVNMEKGINDALNNSGGWNYLYDQVEYFQRQIDTMSWEDFANKFSEVFEDWRKEIGLTTDQWLVLKDAIQGTIWSGKEDYMSFMDKYDEINGRIKAKEDIQNEYSRKVGQSGLTYKYGTLLQAGQTITIPGNRYVPSYSYTTTDEWMPTGPLSAEEVAKHYKKGGGGVLWGELTNGDYSSHGEQDEDTLKEIQSWIDKYVEAKNDIETIKNEMTEGGKQLFNVLSELSGETRDKIATIGEAYSLDSFQSIEDETQRSASEDQFEKVMAMAIEKAKNYTTDSDIGLAMLEVINKQLAEGSLEEGVEAQLNKVKKEIEDEMAHTKTFTWSGILDSVDQYSEDLKATNKALEELNENGAISQDTFAELANTLDTLNLEDIFETFDNYEDGINYVNGLVDALDNLNAAYDVNTGYVDLNKESLEYLQDAQERAAKGRIKAMINELTASRAAAASNVAYIDAQIASLDAMIKYVQAAGDNQIEIDKMMSEANGIYEKSFEENMGNVRDSYSKITGDSAEWAEATIYNISEVADAWSQYWKAVQDGSVNANELKAKAENLSNGYFGSKDDFKKAAFDLSEYDGVSGNSAKGQELLGKLQSYKEGLTEARAKYAQSVAIYDAQISYLQSMYDSDLSKLGTDKGKDSNIEKYIGKLKEIYNILNRIQVLEHRLGTLDSYSEVARGKDYGDLLNERLSYNTELMHQYEFLTEEQKKFTNGYKNFIQSVDGLEGVFSFDKFGQIIVDWERYNALQDTAIDGEVTLKQKADDVYETYTEMFTDLQGYFDNTIKYYQEVIELQQEMVDNYISVQDKAADAIKEIYQKILDTKLDAIDQEKDAIEELRKAREQARKDQENAKAVSGLQTNLQRAMMDTSGASDVSLIKAQQDLDDKLDAIAEDKYSQMLDDIIDQLDEEQEALQDNFDMLFEDMEWLFEYLDEEMMLDEERLTTLLQQTDEWATSSELQRRQLMEEWDKSYNTYMAGLQGGKTIYDIYENIGATKDRINTLDQSLTTTLTNEGLQIRQTIESWQKNVNSTISSAVSSAVSAASKSSNRTYGVTNTNGTKNDSNTSSGLVGPGTSKQSTTSGVQMKTGDKIEFRPESGRSAKVTVYDSGGNPVGTYSNNWWWDKNGTAGDIKTIGGRRMVYFSPAKGYIPTTEFQKQGGTGSGTRYYKHGGFVDFTGPAWLDGTKTRPEAVLTSLQTEHFINFTNALDRLTSGKYNATSGNNSIAVGDITFQVESMSSAEDGEKAFNMFVDKFKEIGNRTGIKVDSFKNTL